MFKGLLQCMLCELLALLERTVVAKKDNPSTQQDDDPAKEGKGGRSRRMDGRAYGHTSAPCAVACVCGGCKRSHVLHDLGKP